jgi:hypothetical protein
MTEGTAERILMAWVELERALREALPVCSVAPPTQPVELLSALRINHRLGEEEEARILALREIRNRVSVEPEEPPEREARAYEEEVGSLKAFLTEDSPGTC